MCVGLLAPLRRCVKVPQRRPASGGFAGSDSAALHACSVVHPGVDGGADGADRVGDARRADVGRAREARDGHGSGDVCSGKDHAVAELAVNRVTLVETSVGNVNNLLLYRSPSKAGYGAYGPIHDSEGASPYGRWASTSQDPCVDDILIADLVLRGQSNLTHLADDQVGPEVEYAAGDPYGRDKNHPVGWGYSSITYYARTAHQYWVGPVPGIDPWSLLMFRTRKDVDYQSDVGKQLIAAGQAAMSDRPSPWTAGHYNRPDWSTTPYCAPGEDSSTEDTGVSTAGLVIGGLLAIAAVGTVAYLGVTGYLGGRVARA